MLFALAIGCKEPQMPKLPISLAVAFLFVQGACGDELITLRGHGGWVGAVAFSPDSRRLAVGAGDGRVTIWDAVLAKKIVMLQPHADAVAALAFSPDGSKLISG